MVTPAAPSHATVRVLGAEPDAVTRALVGLYLEPHGYQVRLAGSVAEAVQMLAETGAEAFLCSERALAEAPESARRALREALQEVPVVALLEPGAAPDLTRNWPSVRQHLTKPLRADALLSVLHAARPAGPVAPPPLARDEAPEALLGGLESLIDEMEMDAAMVRELLASFVERGPAYLQDIADGLAQGELEQVDRAAHTLKGMCGNLRFSRLATLSETLRHAAKGGDPAAAGATLESLRGELARVNQAVRARWLPEA